MPKAPTNAPPNQHAPEPGRLAVTPGDVTAAAAAIRGSVIVTECDQSRTLSEICGCHLWLKFENLQFTSTFKERGALNRLLAEESWSGAPEAAAQTGKRARPKPEVSVGAAREQRGEVDVLQINLSFSGFDL